MKKISVISGGTGGLGLEIAAILTRAGKNVLILGRNTGKSASAVSRLSKYISGNKVEAMICNIGNEEDVLKVGTFLKHNAYSVEYLYNNAGSGLTLKTENSTSDLIDKVFEANVKGMILLTSEVLRITPDENELTIVNIMSTSALYGRADESIYCAAKFGARGYTEALRVELKGKKRNIVAVYPGGMKTDFWDMPGQNRDTSSFMDPAEVAEKIVSVSLSADKMVVTDITINRKS